MHFFSILSIVLYLYLSSFINITLYYKILFLFIYSSLLSLFLIHGDFFLNILGIGYLEYNNILNIEIIKYYFSIGIIEEFIKISLGFLFFYVIRFFYKNKNDQLLYQILLLSVILFFIIENIFYIESNSIIHGNYSILSNLVYSNGKGDIGDIDNTLSTATLFFFRIIFSNILHLVYTGIIIYGIYLLKLKYISKGGFLLFFILGVTLHSFNNILLTIGYTGLFFFIYIISIIIGYNVLLYLLEKKEE